MEEVPKWVRIKPPLFAVGYLLAAWGVHLLFRGKMIAYLHFPIFGSVGLIGGFGLMMWGFGLFQKKKTPVCPTKESTALVVTGPFRFSRNPMYLGITLALLGIAFFVGTFPFLLAPVAFLVTMNTLFIPYEEQKMERIFGEGYRRYKQRVRRWL